VPFWRPIPLHCSDLSKGRLQLAKRREIDEKCSQNVKSKPGVGDMVYLTVSQLLQDDVTYSGNFHTRSLFVRAKNRGKFSSETSTEYHALAV
jgi:hypothetical protein